MIPESSTSASPSPITSSDASALAVVRYSRPEGIRRSIAETLADTGLETSDDGLNGSQRSTSQIAQNVESVHVGRDKDGATCVMQPTSVDIVASALNLGLPDTQQIGRNGQLGLEN